MAMNRDELKRKIADVMKEHLASIGWQGDVKTVMKNLEPMWDKMEAAGLIKPGMTFDQFCLQALQAASFAEIKEAMGG